MKEINIKTQKSARIYFSDEITKDTKEVVIACHGYAQLGKYFIQKFDSIINKQRIVVVPEALNKFYWNGMNGRVVASWMTKEDRKSEIDDYINYLNQVYEMIKNENHTVKITAFGFSQGTSTISRWISQKDYKIDIKRLILWSGSFPMDIIEEPIFRTIPFDYFFGNEDEYISKENISELRQTLNANGINPKFIEFEGGHNIDYENIVIFFT